jgi:hypothetical protein
MQDILQNCINFLQSNIDKNELSVQKAKAFIEHIPISYTLTDKVNDLLIEYAEDNNLSEDWLETLYNLDVEELIFML